MDHQINLQSALLRRYDEIKARNGRFSVRAFARQLGLQASATNEIMKGQRKVSRALAERLAERLKLNTEDRQNILSDYEHSFPVDESSLMRAMEILRRAQAEINGLTLEQEEKVFELTIILSAKKSESI